MNPNSLNEDSNKPSIKGEAIHALPGSSPIIVDKKSLFPTDISADMNVIPFQDSHEQIGVSLGAYDLGDGSSAPLFSVDSSRGVEEEWAIVEKVCSELFLKEIDSYTGRDQQKKGYIMKSVQKRLFGEELPRGHGHKGKLSTKMSILYDELTGRQPRKRRAKVPENDPVVSKRSNLRPQSVQVGVIGSGEYAKLIIQRLLQVQHQVVTVNKDTYNNVLSDPFFSPIVSTMNPKSFQLQPDLRVFCNTCEIILVAIPIESISLPFYIKKDGFFDLVDKRHHIIDLCTEDLTTSNKIHSVASSKTLRYYDCQIFPAPSTLSSFERNQPCVFLGGEFTPCEYVYTVLYSLGKVLFSGRINQGIIYKMIISQYMIMQQQVLKEVYSTASSLGLTDPKLLGKMLSLCANPANIIERNTDFHLLDLQDQRALTIPIETLLSSIKHTFSLPSSYLPVTSIACRVGDEVSSNNGNGKTDISHIWDSILEKPKDVDGGEYDVY